MILDFKTLSLGFVIEHLWYNTLTHENDWFPNGLVKSNFVTPTPYGSVTCFVDGNKIKLVFFLFVFFPSILFIFSLIYLLIQLFEYNS